MSFWKSIFRKADESVSDGGDEPTPHIAVVFPATFPSMSLHVPEPDAHVTIMYLGTYDTVDFTPNDVINALKGVPLNHMLWARVSSKEKFGPDGDIPVLRVQHDMLGPVNESVTAALNDAGIYNPSIYADHYKPHVTVSQETWDEPPHAVLLNHAQLWWRGERLSLTS